MSGLKLEVSSSLKGEGDAPPCSMTGALPPLAPSSLGGPEGGVDPWGEGADQCLTLVGSCYWRQMWEQLNSMRQQWQLCDVTLYSEDNVMYMAHSAVLAASSVVFHAYFVSRRVPHPISVLGERKLMLHGISGEVLQVALDFIYGITPATVSELDKLKVAASALAIHGAFAYCGQKSSDLSKRGRSVIVYPRGEQVAPPVSRCPVLAQRAGCHPDGAGMSTPGRGGRQLADMCPHGARPTASQPDSGHLAADSDTAACGQDAEMLEKAAEAGGDGMRGEGGCGERREATEMRREWGGEEGDRGRVMDGGSATTASPAPSLTVPRTVTLTAPPTVMLRGATVPSPSTAPTLLPTPTLTSPCTVTLAAPSAVSLAAPSSRRDPSWSPASPPNIASGMESGVEAESVVAPPGVMDSGPVVVPPGVKAHPLIPELSFDDLNLLPLCPHLSKITVPVAMMDGEGGNDFAEFGDGRSEGDGSQTAHSRDGPVSGGDIGAQAALGVTDPALRQAQDTLGVTSPALGEAQDDLGVTNPVLSEAQDTLGVTSPVLRGGKDTLGVTSPALRGAQATLGVTSPALREAQVALRGVQDTPVVNIDGARSPLPTHPDFTDGAFQRVDSGALLHSSRHNVASFSDGRSALSLKHDPPPDLQSGGSCLSDLGGVGSHSLAPPPLPPAMTDSEDSYGSGDSTPPHPGHSAPPHPGLSAPPDSTFNSSFMVRNLMNELVPAGPQGAALQPAADSDVIELRQNEAKMYECVTAGCGYSNKHADYLRSHMYHRHGRGKPAHHCTHCTKAYFSAGQLNNHVKRTHRREKRGGDCEAVWCPDCHDAFDSVYKLQTHQLKAHGKGKLFSCEVCQFKSPRKKDVQAHMLSQHGRAPPGVRVYSCPLCEYKCIDRNRYEEHEAMHTGIEKFTCPLCDKAYTTRRGMRTHVKYHSEDRPHRCDTCDATFKVRSKLKDHVKLVHTHAGLKPYQCAYCEHTTALRGNCNQHIKKYHPGLAVRVIDHLAADRKSVKDYDYAGLRGAGIHECTDVTAASWASIGNSANFCPPPQRPHPPGAPPSSAGLGGARPPLTGPIMYL